MADRQGGSTYGDTDAYSSGSDIRRSESNHYFFSGTDADQPMGATGGYAGQISAEVSLWNGQDETNAFLSADMEELSSIKFDSLIDNELEIDGRWSSFNDRLPASSFDPMAKSLLRRFHWGAFSSGQIKLAGLPSF